MRVDEGGWTGEASEAKRGHIQLAAGERFGSRESAVADCVGGGFVWLWRVM